MIRGVYYWRLWQCLTMCDKVTMIRGVYYERLWQCQGCSDKGRSYLLKQPAGPEAMMRSKKRNMRTGDYHCDKDSFGTWEIQGQGSFSSKVIAISLGKLHLDTSTLEWIRCVSFYSWLNCSYLSPIWNIHAIQLTHNCLISFIFMLNLTIWR